VSNDFLWVEKYRPKVIDDCILPETIKNVFKGFVSQGELPNLLLTGSAGVGKTTIAKALCDEIGASYIMINGSDEGRFLDTVRTRIRTFASTVSLTSGASHKVVIIDEADNTTNDVQLSLRSAVEEFHNNCRFIFTCNFINKIIEPLHSRCTVVDFRVKNGQSVALQGQFFERLRVILKKENAKFEDKVLAKLIKRYYPDWRRLINECQRYSANGAIDAAILVDVADVNLDHLLSALKQKDFKTVKNWVVQHMDNDPSMVMRKIYDNLYGVLKPNSIPEAVLVIAKYMRDISNVPDQEINMLACLTEIMMTCEFK
jgi:replication factor C small subunit|tara:strand:+ start:222 stop:1166 length:945 start_codon:yes stop_codon:yes gene_type:complete